MNIYLYGSGIVAPPFLTSAIDGGEMLGSRLCRFIPGETSQLPILKEG